MIYLLLSLGVLIAFFVALFLLFWNICFFRDPYREIPSGRNIVSPADGKVIKIIPFSSKELTLEKGIFGKIKTLVRDFKEGYLVSIFMSPFDVHVNRAPIEGKILSVKHTPGTFYKADLEKAFLNEKNEIVLENKQLGRVKVIQIAGFVARRIECFVKPHQQIAKGARIGRIVHGSQVSLILPKKVKLKLRLHQKVTAGETIIGEY
jgi:phosphatidylserine decarboxylase